MTYTENKHTFQQFPGDPYVNYLNDPFYSTEFKTKANASVTWSRDPVSATIYVERYGRSPNYISTTQQNGYAVDGAGTVAPWTLTDLSVSYKPIDSVELTFAANNVFNKMPPTDNSYLGSSSSPTTNSTTTSTAARSTSPRRTKRGNDTGPQALRFSNPGVAAAWPSSSLALRRWSAGG